MRFVIISAAGIGKRINLAFPKQFYELQAKAILQHTIENVKKFVPEAKIILVLPKAYLDFWKAYCQKKNFLMDYFCIDGGEERFFSIKKALDFIELKFFGSEKLQAEIFLSEKSENSIFLDKKSEKKDKILVAIHDGVRPFVAEKIWQEGFALAAEKNCAIPVLAMTDSMIFQENFSDLNSTSLDQTEKKTEEKNQEVKNQAEKKWKPVDRSLYKKVQTPQFFEFFSLKKAYQQSYQDHFTDDASVYFYQDPKHNLIFTFEGDTKNIKITYPEDLESLK